MKRVVVTGGAGFIGSHLVERLLKEGSEVLVIDDFSTGRDENIQAVCISTGRTPEVVRCDLNDPQCSEAFERFRPTTVFHVAAQANVRRSVQDPAFDARTNVFGTIALLEASRQFGVEGFIFSSTGGAIYGEQEQFPADENHRTRPECPYGISKRAGELYLEYTARTFGFTGVSLRYANVYGPRQNPKGEAGVVAVFADRLLSGQPLTVTGDGEQTRDFIYVGDVVAANILVGRAIAEKRLRQPFTIYNIGWGKETSVNDIVRHLRQIWRDTAPTIGMGEGHFEALHGPALPGEQRRSVVSAARIKEDLGWGPEIEFGVGLSRTIRSFVERSERASARG